MWIVKVGTSRSGRSTTSPRRIQLVAPAWHGDWASAASAMSVRVALVSVLAAATLTIGWQRAAILKVPPIPKAGPLAQPKSIHQVGVPAAATRAVIPPDNPQTPEKIALGQKLFFEGRLSADGTVACSTCHDPARAFTDGKPTSVGIKGRIGQRNAPTILNALYNKTQFWDGRVKTLEEQAALPIVNPAEMGQPTPDDAAKRGWELFNTRARCNKCHALTEQTRDATYFTDNDFHNIGIGIIRHNVVALARQAKQTIKSGDTSQIDRAALQTDMSALGRFLITRSARDIAAFKTPGLRNVLVTGPYFHDGSQETLWDVMDHYNKGDGLQNPYLDEDMQPLALTEDDIDDVVAFLASLTSADYKEQAVKELARQRELSRTHRPQRDTARAFGPKPQQPTPPRP